MRFNSRASIDSSRVGDGGGGGGMSGGGLGGSSIGLPHIAGGGGVIGVIVAIVFVLAQMGVFGGTASTVAGSLSGQRFAGVGLTGSGGTGQTFDYRQCKTGEDANNHPECALVAVENSLTDYWSKQPQVGPHFAPEASITVFHGSVQTNGCGAASTDTGPFYCPNPSTHAGSIYLDPAFYDTIFRQIGGVDAPFVRAYVIAHEYGHHIQDLLGTMSRVHTQQGADSDSVRLELQADCYAGMWTAAATTTPDESGQPLIVDLTSQDINEAISATHAVGDDHIEQSMGGRVNPEQWTHGSSAEREAWFRQGMNAQNDIRACDTFSAADLQHP